MTGSECSPPPCNCDDRAKAGGYHLIGCPLRVEARDESPRTDKSTFGPPRGDLDGDRHLGKYDHSRRVDDESPTLRHAAKLMAASIEHPAMIVAHQVVSPMVIGSPCMSGCTGCELEAQFRHALGVYRGCEGEESPSAQSALPTKRSTDA